MTISPECAVELLEIIKYLDDDLKKKLPQDFEIYLNKIKDDNYHFEIDKKINLFENIFKDETVEVLMSIMGTF